MNTLRGKSDDGPKITVRVEQGHLLPVSAYDAELLGQWRNGAVVEIMPTRPIQRPMERRYFAMLNKLLKEADTPWTNTETAHEAIKLASGFVTSYKKKNGQWGAHPRSITTFTDAELNEFFEIFCGIVSQRFGIDPETLRKESSDIRTESSEPEAPYGVGLDDAPGTSPIPAGVGKPSPGVVTPTPDGPEAGGALESTPRDTSSAEGPNLSSEEWDWLKTVARMLVAASQPGGDVGTVDRQVASIKQFLTPGTISQAAKDKAQMIYHHCRAVTRGQEPQINKVWVASTAGCTVNDLRPESR